MQEWNYDEDTFRQKFPEVSIGAVPQIIVTCEMQTVMVRIIYIELTYCQEHSQEHSQEHQ